MNLPIDSISYKEILKVQRPMVLDLIAYYKQIEEDMMKELDKAIEAGADPHTAIDKLLKLLEG